MGKYRKAMSVLLTGAVVLSMAAGCSGGSQSTPAQPAGNEAQPAGNAGAGEEYAVIMSVNQLEFFDALKGGVNDAAHSIGADWYYAGPQDLAPDKVAEAIDQAVAKQVTGIIVHGQFQETGTAIDNAIAAGVPVVCVNTDIESNRLSFLGCKMCIRDRVKPATRETVLRVAREMGYRKNRIASVLANHKVYKLSLIHI